MLINDHNDQPVTIAFNIENNPIISHETCIAKNGFDICRAGPCGVFHIIKPGLQGYSAVGMSLPKFTQDAAADNSHDMIISQSYHFGNKVVLVFTGWLDCLPVHQAVAQDDARADADQRAENAHAEHQSKQLIEQPRNGDHLPIAQCLK